LVKEAQTFKLRIIHNTTDYFPVICITDIEYFVKKNIYPAKLLLGTPKNPEYKAE